MWLLMFLNILKFVPVSKCSYSPLLTRIVREKNSSGAGCYGSYFILSSSKGMKILREKYDDYEDVMESYALQSAIKEASLLKEARSRYEYIPKCYGVRIIEKDGKYRVGIILQHLDGKLGGQCEHYEERDVRRELEKQLEKKGITHNDLHSENCIWYKEKWWVIDFTPSSIKISA